MLNSKIFILLSNYLIYPLTMFPYYYLNFQFIIFLEWVVSFIKLGQNVLKVLSRYEFFFDEIWIHYITYTSSLSFEIKWPCFVAKYKHRFSSTKMINWQCKNKEIEGQSNLSLLSFDLWKFDSLSLISACQGSRVYLSHFLQR